MPVSSKPKSPSSTVYARNSSWKSERSSNWAASSLLSKREARELLVRVTEMKLAGSSASSSLLSSSAARPPSRIHLNRFGRLFSKDSVFNEHKVMEWGRRASFRFLRRAAGAAEFGGSGVPVSSWLPAGGSPTGLESSPFEPAWAASRAERARSRSDDWTST
eukprot:TRINITY_DN1548_c0_g1_i1.p1 TRINITY_DN1548_c0_g1~~TRINITY_DN1548_c0_g1_i1.p1  ORF type:complete len:162 (-),score=25.04 TRINITY_DN1548_c0_g1_i1:769-1254(-)